MEPPSIRKLHLKTKFDAKLVTNEPLHKQGLFFIGYDDDQLCTRKQMNLHIRNASVDDAKSIADFNSQMASETESRELDPELIGAGVAAILADSNKGQYWVAEADGNVVGQIMVSYEWSDWRNGMLWWIGSVYVHEDYRQKGVFSALYRHVESLARLDQEACGLRLYVEQDNKRAQETYLKLGMVKPGYLVMEADFRNDPK